MLIQNLNNSMRLLKQSLADTHINSLKIQRLIAYYKLHVSQTTCFANYWLTNYVLTNYLSHVKFYNMLG